MAILEDISIRGEIINPTPSSRTKRLSGAPRPLKSLVLSLSCTHEYRLSELGYALLPALDLYRNISKDPQ